MATKKAEFVKRSLHRMKNMLNEMSLKTRRESQDFLSKFKIYHGMDIIPVHDLSIPCEWFKINNKDIDNDKVLLYFHGGGYEMGTLLCSRIFAAKLTKAVELDLFSVEYRLAPENPFPAALDDALEAYKYLLAKGYDPEKIILTGESAGGGLILALGLKLKELNMPLPNSVVCISPWINLTQNESNTDDSIDPILAVKSLCRAAAGYAGDLPLNDPYISPAFAEDYEGFPPVLIHVGESEIFRAPLYDYAEKLKRAGVDITLEIFSDMWHVWHFYDIPEAESALKRVSDYIRMKLKLPQIEHPLKDEVCNYKIIK